MDRALTSSARRDYRAGFTVTGYWRSGPPAVFSPDLVERLARRLDLLGTADGSVITLDDPRLAEVTVLITSWGCPPLEAGVLDRLA